jgi:hypothetical protein
MAAVIALTAMILIRAASNADRIRRSVESEHVKELSNNGR